MGPRLRALMVVAILALGPGCANDKLWRKDPVKMPEGVPTSPLSPMAQQNTGIVQASALMPAPKSSPSLLPFGKTGSKPEKKVSATEMTILWRNKIDYLPDPSPGKNGASNPGLVGQLFLLGARDQFASADGKLVVALYDESPRPPGTPPNKPEGWEFSKETLRNLLTPDERFGQSYALFLPWPTYRPDVTRIRIAASFEPENGHKIYAPETRITIDNSIGGDKGVGWTTQQIVPGQTASGFNLLGGPPPAAGTASGTGPGLGVSVMGGPPPQSGALPAAGMMPMSPGAPLPPAPPGYGALAPVAPGNAGMPISPANIPANLPPLVYTVQRGPGQ